MCTRVTASTVGKIVKGGAVISQSYDLKFNRCHNVMLNNIGIHLGDNVFHFIALQLVLSFMTSSAQLQSGEGMNYDQIYYITASTSTFCPVGQSCLTLS